GGILGTFLVGVFCSTDLGIFSGLGFGGDNASIGAQVKVQVIGIVATFAYTAVVSWVLLKVVDAVLGLRVDEEQETEGLDIVLHEERGYDIL
nr:ammonium transporter [Gammaproteobacteria bacterium]